MARILSEWGAKIVAVSDASGGRFNSKGLNIKKLLEEKKQIKELKDSKEGRFISNKELLELKADVLIPAALEDQITIENADKVKAKIVIEMANAPTTMKADEVLNKKNVLIVPDILANSGGVIVSYFEWAQNLSGEQWSETQIKKMLEEKMKNALNELFKTCEIEKCTPRYSAYLIAVNKILEAEIARGRLEKPRLNLVEKLKKK
jgi:glutamate dehydrogenase/leucine dehydrogenase